jgi:hypothetical protein
MKLQKYNEGVFRYSYGEYLIHKKLEQVWTGYSSSNKVVWTAYRPERITKGQTKSIITGSTLKELQTKIQTKGETK